MIKIYTSNQKNKLSIFSIFFILIKNSWIYRELIFQLFKRDFLMLYKKSFLGLGWHLITPLLGIISWVFMNSAGILKPGNTEVPYPAYVLVGTTIWALFMGIFTNTAKTLSIATGFIHQVNFPHEILLVKQILEQVVVFFISLVIIVATLFFFRVYPTWYLLLTPLLILPIIFISSSIGMLVSLVGVVGQDFLKMAEFGLGILMFFTPIIYTVGFGNSMLQEIIRWNPLTYLIGEYRDLILFGRIDLINQYLIASFISFLVFIISWRIFYVTEARIVEKIN